MENWRGCLGGDCRGSPLSQKSHEVVIVSENESQMRQTSFDICLITQYKINLNALAYACRIK